ncbi:MAG: hypothetical protein H6721_29535 [Sandaracinus sp.]|nr:hypothetical protein [Sandaracinus sp.]
MGALHVVGVRHHSPACARLVRHVIAKVRPRTVLIEGPLDWNERLDELRLPHAMPIAIFTYERGDGRNHASWTPFCEYSPEWVALQSAQEHGSDAYFFDLPAWDRAFEGVRHRFADRLAREDAPPHSTRYVDALCRQVGVDDMDTLWDHLFEQPMPQDVLHERLTTYFESLRSDESAGDRDERREATMVAITRWALERGDVVVVCGGYHAPVIAREGPKAEPRSPFELPPPPPPSFDAFEDSGEDDDDDDDAVVLPDAMPLPTGPVDSSLSPVAEVEVRRGSYLVPFTEKRLDAFAGYESGMPSPAFQRAVWESGADVACETLLSRAVKRLRDKKQPVSTADLIACAAAARGLARIRGHEVLGRTDLLDAVASTLLKDALETPLPWARRGTLLPRTDPLLVEVVAAFSGEARGKLAPGTPRPPLPVDVEAELERRGLEPKAVPREIVLRLAVENERASSRVLHRLRVLNIPGFVRLAGPKLATDAQLEEKWRIGLSDDLDSALVEAASYGGTLEAAATARLEEALLLAGASSKRLAEVLGEAAFTGIDTLTDTVIAQVATAIASEGLLGDLGTALHVLFDLFRHGDLVGARNAPALARILEAGFDRGLWLVEGVVGGDAPADAGHLHALVALRDLARRGPPQLSLPLARAEGVMQRRALDDDAPPALRGAALGWLWSQGALSDADGSADEHAERAVRGASRPSMLGDFLAGLFALARDEVLGSEALVAVLDQVIQSMNEADFLVALPSLRFSASWFPPKERERLARLVLGVRGEDTTLARSLLKLPAAAGTLVAGHALDGRVADLAARYGLCDELDPPSKDEAEGA